MQKDMDRRREVETEEWGRDVIGEGEGEKTR